MTSGTLKLLVENHKSNLIKKKFPRCCLHFSHCIFLKTLMVFCNSLIRSEHWRDCLLRSRQLFNQSVFDPRMGSNKYSQVTAVQHRLQLTKLAWSCPSAGFPKLANQNRVRFLGRKGGGVLKTQDLQWCVSQKG